MTRQRPRRLQQGRLVHDGGYRHAGQRGLFAVTGRKKDIIIRGGHNIHPARIEELATRHPAVKRAAAVPVKDSRLGEKVCLVVACHEGRAITPEDLLAHLDATGLSKYDMPEYYLAIEEIPVTPNGKMLKRDIVNRIKDGHSNRSRSASRGAPAIKEKQCMRAVVVREFGGIEKSRAGGRAGGCAQGGRDLRSRSMRSR